MNTTKQGYRRPARAVFRLLAAVLLGGGLVLGPARTKGAVMQATHPEYRWYAFSPGNMTQETLVEKGPGGAGDVRRLCFTASDKHPGEYWVGAGIELAAPRDHNVITFYIRKLSRQQRTVSMKVLDSRGRQGFYELGGVPADWIKAELRREQPVHTGGGDVPRDIARIEFNLLSSWFKPGEVWTVDVAGLRTEKTTPLRFHDPLWMPSRVPPPVPGYRVEVAIHNIWPEGATYPGLDDPAGAAMARNITAHLLREFGPVGIEIGYLRGETGRSFARFLRTRGALSAVTAHNHAAFEQQEDGRSLTAEEKDALQARNAAGQNPVERGLDPTHSEDITNPRFLKLAQQLYLNSARAGAQVYRPVDYVWPYVGGGLSWTYSPSAIAAWPRDLQETDAGLELGKGREAKKPRARRVVHFWEYFASYHGYRMRPEDVGLRAWEQYRPPAPDAPDSPHLRNSRIVLNLLYHYEWLKFANEVTRPSAAQYGMLTQPVVNPEEINNGTDLYWLSRLAFARGFWAEWWGHPAVVVPTYYNGRYYDNVVRANGKEIVLGGEVAAAGGDPYRGRPHYWDNLAGYLVAYAQAGSVDARAQNHQYWGWTWERAIDPKRPEYAAYAGMRASFCGFLQNRNDRAAKPRTDLLAVTTRAVTHGVPYFDHGSDQPYNLGQELVKRNYLHDGAAFPIDDAFALKDYQTIVFSSFEPPRGFAQKLRQWLAAGAKRTLIIHSFVPTRYSAPVTELRPDPIAFLQPGGQEKRLGFGSIRESAVSSGILRARHPIFKVALRAWDGKSVTFSRGVCRTAGVPGQKALVTLGDLPLVSEHRCGKGRVLYLHFFANEGGITRGKLQEAIVDAVMRYCGYQPTAITPEGVYALRFRKPDGGSVFLTINAAARTDLQDDRGRRWRVFQARNPGARGTIRLRAGKPGGAFRVTDLITGDRRQVIADHEGYIRVSADGWNLRGMYVEEDRGQRRR